MRTSFPFKDTNAFCVRLFLSMLFVFVPLTAWSSPAFPNFIEFRQPDGTIVKVRMMGDEDLRWAETEDGYTLLFDDEGYLVYAEKSADGTLTPTGIRATDELQRSMEVRQRLNKIGKKASFSESQVSVVQKNKLNRAASMRRKASSHAGNPDPIVGTRKHLVILVDFPDLPFSCSKQDFDDLLNKEHNPVFNPAVCSVKDFYREASFGQLDLQTTVLGVYRMSHPMAYYGRNSGGHDQHAAEMVEEAVALADSDVDFSEFDNDHDGVVDGMHIIYAGYGEDSGGGADCIWAHASSIYSSYDGVKLSSYSCSSELRGNNGKNITHIGVICHELGHVFGTPDFYDTNYGIRGSFPSTGQWDIMSEGEWNEAGASPAMFNPYSVIYDFGWAEVMDGNKPCAVTLRSKDKKHGYLRIDTSTKGEFYLLEYRERSGFDLRIPGHGMIIYHALDNLSRRNSNTLNAFYPQQFYVVSANATNAVPNDNPLSYGTVNSASCPFPGSLGKKDFTDFTIPSMVSYGGAETNMPITNIEEDEIQKTVSFYVSGGGYSGAYALKIVDSGADFISLSWRTSVPNAPILLVYSNSPNIGTPTADTYNVGDEIPDGGTVIYNGTDASFIHTGLQDFTAYYYTVFTKLETGWVSSLVKMARTETGIIREFPFWEDFSSGKLEKAWRQEVLERECYWAIDKNHGYLRFASGNDPISTRLIFPTIDFTGHQSAIFSFDYTNNVDHAELFYRTSESDEWHLLKEIELTKSRNYYDLVGGRFSVELPNLSSHYQVSILPYMNRHNSGGSSSNEHIWIDDVCIEVDVPVMFERRPVFRDGTTYVEIPVSVIPIDEQPTSVGIALSEDSRGWWSLSEEKQNWQYYTRSKSDTLLIEGLKAHKYYHYKPFALVGDKYYFGAIGSFMTLSLTNGNGTPESPYIISSSDEWKNMAKDFSNDSISSNILRNVYFRLDADITVTTDNCPKYFNSNFDGNGHTITYSSPVGVIKDGNSISGVFNYTDHYANIHDLNVRIKSIKADYAMGLCSQNRGKIRNCKVTFVADESSTYTSAYGITEINFYFGDDYGLIDNCHVEFLDTTRQIRTFGICYQNYGGCIISNCTIRGRINNAGVVLENAGVVANCVNYADVMSGSGIVNENTGIISACANHGALYGAATSGIVNYNDENAFVGNCYSDGTYYGLQESNSDEPEYSIAGIANKNFGEIVNCFFAGKLPDKYQYKNKLHVIVCGNVSKHYNISGCYNFSYIKDEDAESLDRHELYTQNFVDLLNENSEQEIWTLTEAGVRLKCESRAEMSQNYAFFDAKVYDVRPTQITMRATAIMNGAHSYGVQYKEHGETAWEEVSAKEMAYSNVRLGNLKPFTMYEYRLFTTDKDNTKYTSGIRRFVTLPRESMTPNDTLFLYNLDDLKKFAYTVTEQGHQFRSRVIKLASDIDMHGDRGELWTPITGHFSGDFDGGGRCINNLRVVQARGNVGLWGDADSCSIHDLHIRNAYLESGENRNHLYPGVGGIAGSVMGDKVYRCSFEGTIVGGYNTGAIVGVGKINNCYANAEILIGGYSSNNTNNIGCMVGQRTGQGTARNSYFRGTCASEKGIVGLCENGATQNCYLEGQETGGGIYTYSKELNGEYLSIDDMKNGTLLSKLPSDQWMADSEDNPVNGGYPILLNQKTEARIVTEGVTYDEHRRVYLEAQYLNGGSRKDTCFGYEWRKNQADNQRTNISRAESKSNLQVRLDSITSGEYYYRAFATTVGSDTIYGQWMSFKKSETDAIPFVESIEDKAESRQAIFTFGLNSGDEFVHHYELECWQKNNRSDTIIRKVENISAPFTLDGIEPLTKYCARLNGYTEQGHKCIGTTYTWMTGIDKSIYLNGDANADGTVSMADVVTTLDAYLDNSPEKYSRVNADTNMDGKINRHDAENIITQILSTHKKDDFPMAPASAISLKTEVLDMADSSRIVVHLTPSDNVTAFRMNLKIPRDIKADDIRVEYPSNDSLSREVRWMNISDTVVVTSFSWQNKVYADETDAPVVVSFYINESKLPYLSEIQVELVDCRVVDTDYREYRMDDLTATLPIHDPYLIDGVYYGLSGDNAMAKSLTTGEYEGEVIVRESVNLLGKERKVIGYSYGIFGSKVTSLSLPGTIQAITGLSKCTNLTNISLHEGTQSIEKDALKGTQIKRLYIPASVSNISGTIANEHGNSQDMGIMTCLEAIEVCPASKFYKSVDGVLYTKDGTQLVKFPTARSGMFMIPEGVEKLGYNAFDAENSLDVLFLPSTLKAVGTWSLGNNPKVVAYCDTPAEIFNRNSDRRWNYTIYVPSQALSAYVKEGAWKNIIPFTETETLLHDGWNWISFNSLSRDIAWAEAITGTFNNAISIQTQNKSVLNDPVLGWVGDVEYDPTTFYKIKSTSEMSRTIGGAPCLLENNPVNIYPGWNWIGYLPDTPQYIAKATAKYEPVEGDIVLGQDELATYADGVWHGDFVMKPGKGYMYYSAAPRKRLLTYTKSVSGEGIDNSSSANSSQTDNYWSYNPYAFANTTPMFAKVAGINHTNIEVGVFVKDECRGTSNTVGGCSLLAVHGEKDENLNFMIFDRMTGAIYRAKETAVNNCDMIGTFAAPFTLTLGELIGYAEDITPVISSVYDKTYDVYTVTGVKIATSVNREQYSQLPHGIYIVNGKKVIK